MTTTIHLAGDDDVKLYDYLSGQLHTGIGREFLELLGNHVLKRNQNAEEVLTDEERLVKAGEDKARIRELEEWADKDRHEIKRLTSALKAMTEELEKRRALDGAVGEMVEDEFELTRAFVTKLMGEGRTEHGPLNLAADERDLLGEAADELNDSIAYLLMEQRRLLVRRRVA